MSIKERSLKISGKLEPYFGFFLQNNTIFQTILLVSNVSKLFKKLTFQIS